MRGVFEESLWFFSQYCIRSLWGETCCSVIESYKCNSNKWSLSILARSFPICTKTAPQILMRVWKNIQNFSVIFFRHIKTAELEIQSCVCRQGELSGHVDLVLEQMPGSVILQPILYTLLFTLPPPTTHTHTHVQHFTCNTSHTTPPSSESEG